jgi:DNA-binding transcriptional LysR family regulator
VAAFVAVVDAGGFNAASRHLGLSAQAVQKAVDRMEAELEQNPIASAHVR